MIELLKKRIGEAINFLVFIVIVVFVLAMMMNDSADRRKQLADDVTYTAAAIQVIESCDFKAPGSQRFVDCMTGRGTQFSVATALVNPVNNPDIKRALSECEPDNENANRFANCLSEYAITFTIDGLTVIVPPG